MKVSKCPESQSKTNRAIVSPADLAALGAPHVEVRTGAGSFIFSLAADASIASGEIGFSMPQRKWAQLSVNQEVGVAPYTFDKNRSYVAQVGINQRITARFDYWSSALPTSGRLLQYIFEPTMRSPVDTPRYKT